MPSKLDEFEVKDMISKGSFGTVYKAVRKADGRLFALKQVSLKGMKRLDREEAIDEARMLSQLNHPHVVKYYDSFIDGSDKLNILMEYASRGSLSAVVKGQNGKGLPEDFIWKCFIQAILGLNHIHKRKIIHRDIKTLNLFLDSSNNIKVGDLGIARALSDNSDFARTIVGTPFYLSPELCEDKPYNEKSDVWALGVVLYECCMGRYPFEAKNEGALIRKILRGQYAPVQSSAYTKSLLQMVELCLTLDWRKRPDTNQLLAHSTVGMKAQQLGIDLNPKVPVTVEDPPVFERQSNSPGPSLRQYSPPMHADAVAHVQRQQQQAVVTKPFANIPAQHPFAHPQGQQCQPALNMQFPNPRQNPGNPGHNPIAHLNDAEYQLQHLMAAVQNMNVDVNGWNRVQQDQAERGRGNMHAGQHDHVKGVLYAASPESVKRPQRLNPENLPAAGIRPGSACKPNPPFGQLATNPWAYRTASQEQAEAVWSVRYEKPQYARRRCPELQITGPSLRGGINGRAPQQAWEATAADDATTYVSTSYYSHHR